MNFSSPSALAAAGGGARLGLKLAFVLMLAAAAGLASESKLLGFVQTLELGTYLLGVGAVLRALIRREGLQSTTIGGWDEAVGFGLVALLSHIAIPFVR
jgi:hypothetical protein